MFLAFAIRPSDLNGRRERRRSEEGHGRILRPVACSGMDLHQPTPTVPMADTNGCSHGVRVSPASSQPDTHAGQASLITV